MKPSQDEIQKTLEQRGATEPCARCGSTKFTILNAFSQLPIVDKLSNNITLGGANVPCAIVACNNCGAITHHALGPLGLLPDDLGGEK